MQLKIILQSKIFYVVIILMAIIYLIINININKKSIYNLNNHVFYGQIIKIKKSDYRYSLLLKSKENLIVYTNSYKYELGDYVKIIGDLEEPSNNTLPNNYNYKKHLNNNKIYYILNAKEISLVYKNNYFYKLKNKLLNYINTYKSAPYLKTLLLGESNLDHKIYNSYQLNGIVHLLSITSFFISFLCSKIINYFNHKNNIYLLLIILIFLFLLLTNYSIVILKVWLLLIIRFLNKKYKFNLSSIKVFIIVLVITLIINPFYIYNKGFIYSYYISFIIILNKNIIKGTYLKRLLIISSIIFLFCIPLNIYFNYYINLLSIFYSIFYMIIFNFIIIPLALLILIIKPLDLVFYSLITLLNNLSFSLNKISFCIFSFKKINIFILLLYLISFIYLIKKIFTNKKYTIIIILILVTHYYINYIFIDNYVLFLNVKQGDSTLLNINNNSLLIDSGGLYNSDLGDNLIITFRSLGLKKINYFIVTHGDFDHMGEAINLVNNFKVEKVIFNCGEFNDLEKELIKVLDKKKINYYSCIKELNIDNNKLYFLQTKEYDNENDFSNVIYTDLNGYKFMFMGDASTTTEKEILNKYNLSDIDVLKVGHHGSKTSSGKEFINEVNPKYSIISVGKNNRYGHPNKEVLDNLDNSKIYRTDQDGSIMFKIKNNKLKIVTCSP